MQARTHERIHAMHGTLYLPSKYRSAFFCRHPQQGRRACLQTPCPSQPPNSSLNPRMLGALQKERGALTEKHALTGGAPPKVPKVWCSTMRSKSVLDVSLGAVRYRAAAATATRRKTLSLLPRAWSQPGPGSRDAPLQRWHTAFRFQSTSSFVAHGGKTRISDAVRPWSSQHAAAVRRAVHSVAEGEDGDVDDDVGVSKPDDENYRAARLESLAEMEGKGLQSFPPTFPGAMPFPDFLAKYDYLAPGERAEADGAVALAGRVHGVRKAGKKLLFLDLKADGARVQAMCDQAHFAGDWERDLLSRVRRGDVVGARGTPARNKRGELCLVRAPFPLPCVSRQAALVHAQRRAAFRCPRRSSCLRPASGCCPRLAPPLACATRRSVRWPLLCTLRCTDTGAAKTPAGCGATPLPSLRRREKQFSCQTRSCEPPFSKCAVATDHACPLSFVHRAGALWAQGPRSSVARPLSPRPSPHPSPYSVLHRTPARAREIES